MRLPFPPSPLTVWAVEDTSAQLCWGNLPAGTVTATAGDATASIEHSGGAGSIVIDGLAADATTAITVNWDGGSVEVHARTLRAPDGELLYRFATVSDLHLGATRWGVLKTMTDETAGLSFDDGLPLAAATAAITEALDWGARHLIIKGDAAHHRVPEHFAQVGTLVDRFPDLPMHLLPGNHDVDNKSTTPLPATVGNRQLRYLLGVDHIDVPGLRLIAANVAVEGRGDGKIDLVRDPILDVVADGQQSAFIATHQQFQKHAFITHWPPGVRAPESNDLFADLHSITPNVVLSSGHTHRNRVHRRHGVLHTEVASTRDWPGVWAGYSVYEGGLMQTVRRIAEPTVMAWHDYSKNAVGGLWWLWAPGKLSDRSLTETWCSNSKSSSP